MNLNFQYNVSTFLYLKYLYMLSKYGSVERNVNTPLTKKEVSKVALIGLLDGHCNNNISPPPSCLKYVLKWSVLDLRGNEYTEHNNILNSLSY